MRVEKYLSKISDTDAGVLERQFDAWRFVIFGELRK